ncbi:hypothetical protein BDR26DRAFT_854733 [Obelidium mucronatum]|nr:hypothetical protein BDR26DRAFT_854733 [Obelidium mucronatum]
MGKTTASEQQFLTSTLLGLAKRPVRNAFDAKETSEELYLLPAASRPFALNGPSEAADSEEPKKTFGITVKALKGNTAPTAIDKLDGFDTVDSLKQKVAKAYGIHAGSVRLVFKGKALAGAGKTLSDCGVGAGALVHLMVAAAAAAAAGDEAVRCDAFTEAARDVGANAHFWAAVEKTVAVQFAGNKEHANKVMNAFIVGFAGLLTDKDAAEKVKNHARK